MKTLNILDFESLDELVNELIEDISDEDEFTSATVVCDTDMAFKLLRRLFEIDKRFHPEFIDIDTVDYDGFYYLSIANNYTVSCEAIIIMELVMIASVIIHIFKIPFHRAW